MKNLKIYALAGIAAIAVAGGSFAYYTTAQTFSNPFDTTWYDSYTIEKFNPSEGKDWKPGAKVDKVVNAKNTGEGDVWVRIKFTERWKSGEGVLLPIGNNRKGETESAITSESGRFNPTEKTTVKDEEVPIAGNHQTKTNNNKDDGQVTGDGSVVFKGFNNLTTDPDSTGESWYLQDEYYYYTSPLKSNETTENLLEYVQLCADTDMGLYEEVKKYCVLDKKPDGTDADQPAYPGPDPSKWQDMDGEKLPDNILDPETEEDKGKYLNKTIYTYKADELNKDKMGYAGANYELDIKVEIVQADTKDAQAAKSEGWAWWPGKSQMDSARTGGGSSQTTGDGNDGSTDAPQNP